MFNTGLLTVLAASPAAAVILYATAYNDHTVTSLEYDPKGTPNLKVISKSTDCGSEPTWLTLDKSRSILYCLNEGWGGAASLTSYKTSANGTLQTLDVIPVLKSPVASTLYGPNNSALAVAH
jgi:6-phosphogluconolactonase (cycloisomerase 2 family)